jgi:hypothetical protein
MKLEYSLEKNDYVTFQLFAAAKSKRITKKRRNNKIILPLIYLGLAVVTYFVEDIGLSIIFLFIGLLWFLFYPAYEKKKYFRHYDKYIEENYKNRFGKVETLNFEEDYVLSKDYTGEGKLFLSEVEELNEIEKYYFLKFNSGVSLIIPKSKIDNLDQLSQYLKSLVSSLNIKHNIELTWEWK